MYRRTGEFYGINEGLFSSAFAAMVFSLFSAQPLTIVGITGLISLFNYTIFDIINIYDPSIYPSFMCWTAIWAAIFHWIAAICNMCDYMRYVTDFSSEAFGMYVGIIYCSKSSSDLQFPASFQLLTLMFSQGSGRIGQRVHNTRPRRWVSGLHDCDSLLPHHLWTGEAGCQYHLECIGPWANCRLCLSGTLFSLSVVLPLPLTLLHSHAISTVF